MHRSSPRLHRFQTGMSKWGWLAFIIAIVGAGTTALRLGPHYIDHRILQGVVERLPQGEVHNEWSKNDIREHFTKQFRIENFPLKVKDILKIERDRERTVVDINYEVREHLFHNIDVVLTFGEQRTFE